MKMKQSRILVFSLIIVALVMVLAFSIGRQKQEAPQNLASADAAEKFTPQQATSGIEPENNADAIQKQNPAALDKEIVAVVNHFRITEPYLNQRYQALPAEYQQEFKNDLEGLLDQLIVRELLYQRAEQKGFAKGITNSDAEQAKDMAIEKYLKEMIAQIQVSDAEIKSFYNEHISEMQGASLEQVKTNIKSYLLQQKQGELVNQTIEQLKNEANVTRNEAWLAKQRALKPPNPLEPALKSGKPTVLDLGASSCIPCKMMKPIFAELEQSLKGKANVILLEISDHRDLARQYRVRVIPTQIFFDPKGEVFWRHEGFLPKEEIIKKLQEMGME